VTSLVRFEPEGHRYYLGEQRVPSVSEVLEPLQMLDGIPPTVLEHARILGQHVHTACHLMVHKILEWRLLDTQLVPYVTAAKKFLEDTSFKVLISEHRMADEGLKFAGTLDLLGVLGRYTAVVDWKVTSAMPRTAGPQTAAYDYLYRRGMGGRPMKRYGCQLFGDGSYKLHQFEDERDWSWFTSALNIWHWRNNGRTDFN
jgi:hypothetical protein